MQASFDQDALYIIFAVGVTSDKDHRYMTCRGKNRNLPLNESKARN